MLKELLDALGKIKFRPLLNVFSALAFSTFMGGGGPVKDPFSVKSLLLPFSFNDRICVGTILGALR